MLPSLRQFLLPIVPEMILSIVPLAVVNNKRLRFFTNRTPTYGLRILNDRALLILVSKYAQVLIFHKNPHPVDPACERCGSIRIPER